MVVVADQRQPREKKMLATKTKMTGGRLAGRRRGGWLKWAEMGHAQAKKLLCGGCHEEPTHDG